MAKKRGFDLKKEYSECWKYIKKSRKFIYAVIGVFFVFAFIGFFVPAPAYITEQIIKLFEDILAKTEGLSQFQLIKFIFFNNIKSSFFGMAAGILFGIFPVLVAILNGYVLGFVSVLSVSENGILSLLLLLPHGIFELTAIFLSLGLGIVFGYNFSLNLYKTYFKKILSFRAFFILGILFLPLTLFLIPLTFLFFLFRNYISYYWTKKKYFFVIFSIIISPIMIFNIIFNRKLETKWNKDYASLMKVFLLMIIPLLFVAAIIEGIFIALG